jgi:hypothetical protein
LNSDDKRLLRKFIQQRADRTKCTLDKALRRQTEEATRPRRLGELTDIQKAAVEGWNAALSTLADAANALSSSGLHYDDSRQYYPREKTIDIKTADSFNERTIKDKVALHDSIRSAAQDALKAEHKDAIDKLDRVVDEALLDMLSMDLPGVRETLAKLTEAFASVVLGFGSTEEDLPSE